MTQTFDIRFARSVGLAALLEVPENVFRWKGGGHLRIDAQGISISVKRGLLALLGGKHTQRIPTESLRAVYREGDALRVEFQSGDTARVVLPFWAGDRDTAAQIVRLLPTSHTVELEHSTDATRPEKPRSDWRLLLSIGALLAVLLVVAWAFYPRERAMIETAAPARPLETSAPVAPAEMHEQPAAQTGPLVVPIAKGSPAYEVALGELRAFEVQTMQLEVEWRNQFRLLVAGALTREIYAEKTDEFIAGWWNITFWVLGNDRLADPALFEFRAAMLGTARLWRDFHQMYAKGLRERDDLQMTRAVDEISRALETQSKTRLILGEPPL
jgi:hypothetical protein